MSWLGIGKTYYYLLNLPETTGLFLKQMFHKTQRDRLISTGDGPALGYQPHKDTDISAGFLSAPGLRGGAPRGSTFWLLGSEGKHFTSLILYMGAVSQLCPGEQVPRRLRLSSFSSTDIY